MFERLVSESGKKREVGTAIGGGNDLHFILS